MNIQEEVSKIHAQYGVSELANYKIQLLCEKYAEQQNDVIYDLFNKPLEKLKPLEDLWRKENSPDSYITPDRTQFYKWIVGKILNP